MKLVDQDIDGIVVALTVTEFTMICQAVEAQSVSQEVCKNDAEKLRTELLAVQAEINAGPTITKEQIKDSMARHDKTLKFLADN